MYRCCVNSPGKSIIASRLDCSKNPILQCHPRNWSLSAYVAKLDCFQKILKTPVLRAIQYISLVTRAELPNVSSTIRVNRLLNRGYRELLAHVTGDIQVRKEFKWILVVCNYLDVFLNDPPGLPP